MTIQSAYETALLNGAKPMSNEQLNALRLFAHANGRRWKSELNLLWYNGAYSYAVLGGADPWILQQIRNTFGPSWLTAVNSKWLLAD